IMLVLLIIFMVTTSVSLESGLDIDIPKAATQTSAQEGKSVIISLDKQGTLSVQGKKLPDRQALEAAIKEALVESNTSSVILEGDQTSSLGSAIEIIDIAKKAGAQKFSIAAENP